MAAPGRHRPLSDPGDDGAGGPALRNLDRDRGGNADGRRRHRVHGSAGPREAGRDRLQRRSEPTWAWIRDGGGRDARRVGVHAGRHRRRRRRDGRGKRGLAPRARAQWVRTYGQRRGRYPVATRSRDSRAMSSEGTRTIYLPPWRVDVVRREGVATPVPAARLARAVGRALEAAAAPEP